MARGVGTGWAGELGAAVGSRPAPLFQYISAVVTPTKIEGKNQPQTNYNAFFF